MQAEGNYGSEIDFENTGNVESAEESEEIVTQPKEETLDTAVLEMVSESTETNSELNYENEPAIEETDSSIDTDQSVPQDLGENEKEAGETVELDYEDAEENVETVDTTLNVEAYEPTDVLAFAHSIDKSKIFKGWAEQQGGEVVYPAYQTFTLSEPTTLYAVWGTEAEERPLDINARLNGSYRGNTSGILTFDVYIDGILVKEGATDFYKKYPVGTSYEIKNVRAAEGYDFAGVSLQRSYGGCLPNASLSGYVAAGGVNEVVLAAVSDDYSGKAGNVVKDPTRPRIETALADGATKNFLITSKPTATSAFAGWDMIEDVWEVAWGETHYLDVNARLDKKYKGNTKDFATFDVYINGELSARHVNDYYKRWPQGTDYRVEFTDVKYGYSFKDVSTSSSNSAYTALGALEGVTANNKGEVLAEFESQKNYVDINGYVDGAYKGSVAGYATFDVYANGELVKEGATDFYKQFVIGTEIEIKNIQMAEGYELVGPSERNSYKNVFHQTSLKFNVDGEQVNDVLLEIRTAEEEPKVMIFAVTENATNVKATSLSTAEKSALKSSINDKLASEAKHIDSLLYAVNLDVDGEGNRGLQFVGLTIDKASTRIFVVNGNEVTEIKNFSVFRDNIAFKSEVFGNVAFVTTADN